MHNIGVSTLIGAKFWVMKLGLKLIWEIRFRKLILELTRRCAQNYTSAASEFMLASKNSIRDLMDFGSKLASEQCFSVTSLF